MRQILVTMASVEDLRHARHLVAAEGYVDLGMYEEADEELRQMDPIWFLFDQTRALQFRVCAALHRPVVL